MPLCLDLATRLLRFYHEGRTITEMAVLLSRPEDEVREALTMLGVAKAPGPFARRARVSMNTLHRGMQGATAEQIPSATTRAMAATAVAVIALGLMAPLAQAEIAADQLAQFAALRAEARGYELGDKVPKDPVRAQETYCKAARMGDAEAQYRLGWMYTFGRGILAPNDGLAAFFFRLAADQGHERARNMLQTLGEPEAYAPECMRDPIVENFDPESPVFESREDPFTATTPEQSRIVRLVESIAPDYGVSPRLALAVIRVESNFNPMARSPKNAQGLMQLIPETSIRFKVKNPYDPVQNLRGGLSYLRWLLAYFEGNVALVAAAYNSGEQTVNRYRGVPPYAETRAYVEQVRQIFRRNDHPYDARVTEPSPELPRIRPISMH